MLIILSEQGSAMDIHGSMLACFFIEDGRHGTGHDPASRIVDEPLLRVRRKLTPKFPDVHSDQRCHSLVGWVHGTWMRWGSTLGTAAGPPSSGYARPAISDPENVTFLNKSSTRHGWVRYS
ncbi:hypothetical protein [Paenarthrobacter aurescens]|uniref:hypothetical protein n=1 Tax=Paenarthrobacter aurescens TaxID=43663 RepID=UPI0021BE6737|nr:hypothetical protein [Paenarthrobacter aurescens]MCT9869180.1 hypothetical protein [Paenarthrobacter aurescens]